MILSRCIIQVHICPEYSHAQLCNTFCLDNMFRINYQAIVSYYFRKFNKYLQQQVQALSHLLLCTNAL
jgi:hypothetical protein